MNEQFENLHELALVIISKLSWYTEEARDKAFALVRDAQAAVTKKPVAPKKTTPPPTDEKDA